MITRFLLCSLVITAPQASLAQSAELPAVGAQTTNDKAALLAAQPYCLDSLRGASNEEAEGEALNSVFPRFEPIVSLSQGVLMQRAGGFARRLCPYVLPSLAVKEAERQKTPFRKAAWRAACPRSLIS